MNLTHEQATEWLHEYANQSHPDDVNAIVHVIAYNWTHHT